MFDKLAFDEELKNGLVGHWKMRGDAKDSSRFQNHGTVTGVTLTTDRYVRVNSAYSLEDLNTINLPFQSIVNYTDDFTVSFWYKKSVAQTGHRNIFWNRTNETNVVGLQVYTQTNTLIFFKYNGTSMRLNGYVVLDTWNHIVIGQSSGNLFLRVNNNNQTEARRSNISPTAFSDNQTFFTGPTSPGINSISDVRIYNRALSQAEITKLYRSVS